MSFIQGTAPLNYISLLDLERTFNENREITGMVLPSESDEDDEEDVPRSTQFFELHLYIYSSLRLHQDVRRIQSLDTSTCRLRPNTEREDSLAELKQRATEATVLCSLGQYHKHLSSRPPVLTDTRYSRDQRVEGNIHLATIGFPYVGTEDQQLWFCN